MKKIISLLLCAAMLLCAAGCGETAAQPESSISAVASATVEEVAAEEVPAAEAPAEEVPTEETPVEEPVEETPAYVPTEEEQAQRAEIENALNLKNNPHQEWTYTASADAWVLSVVSAVVNPELPEKQGVSVAVPGAYVTGIDTDGDGMADVTAADGETAVKGGLVIDYEAEIVSTNSVTYTAATAPVILTTGAMGYSSQSNTTASTGYAAEGYIAMSCGNRGKQDSVTDEAGNVLYYTGDAPSCLCDQKAATRFVKYNMLLGNLPGDVDRFVTTGGSGGAAHASMFAATSNNPDFYDYQIESGAVGVYQNSDGSYTSAVTVDGQTVALSDGAWGSVAYSTISSLYEADMAQAFEYYIDTTYTFSSDFQAQLAEYLAAEYMTYINGQNLSVEEGAIGHDVNGDGDKDDNVALTIEYDPDAHPETNGYYGTYLDLYLCEFIENLQWYAENVDQGEDWTWFDENGVAYTDEALNAMTDADFATAFVEGRYVEGSTGSSGGMGGPGGPGDGGPPDGGPMDGGPMGTPPDLALGMFGDGIRDGGPLAGTTAAAGGGTDSANYATFEEMAAAYASDIDSVLEGDQYGKNIVDLYNPRNYIGAEGTENPAWTRILMGAVEGDIAMMCSLNLQIDWLAAGTDAVIEWQWDGGHVPSDILGQSLAKYVDAMVVKHGGGTYVPSEAAAARKVNGTATEPTGEDLTDWVVVEDGKVSFSLADAMTYRNSGASKAVPGFDVIDYGQEDWVFGNDEQDARHWNVYLKKIFEEHADVLAPLFNAG